MGLDLSTGPTGADADKKGHGVGSNSVAGHPLGDSDQPANHRVHAADRVDPVSWTPDPLGRRAPRNRVNSKPAAGEGVARLMGVKARHSAVLSHLLREAPVVAERHEPAEETGEDSRVATKWHPSRFPSKSTMGQPAQTEGLSAYGPSVEPHQGASLLISSGGLGSCLVPRCGGIIPLLDSRGPPLGEVCACGGA